MPRAEAGNIEQTVKDAVKACYPNMNITAQAVGSFRRGKEMCGDVDVLITCDDNIKNEL